MQARGTASRFVGTADSIGTKNIMDSQEGEAAAQQAQLSAPSPAQSQLSTPTGGQPGPQQATQGQMANTGTSTGAKYNIKSTKSTIDPEECRFVQQLLMLLLHADKCQRRESQANGEMRQCTLPDCKTMKNVLNHMTNCQAEKNCTVPQCRIYRWIISHWKHCKRSDCPICLPIKQAQNGTISAQEPAIQPNNQPNPSPSKMRWAYDTLGIQCPTTTPGLLPGQGVGRGVRMPVPGMTDGPPGALDNVGLVQSQTQIAPGQSVAFAGQQVVAPNVSFPLNSDPSIVGVAGNQTVSTTGPTATDAAAAVGIQVIPNGLQDLQFPGGLQFSQVTAIPVQGTKEWHLSVTPDIRNHHVHQLIQAMFPTPSPQAMLDKTDKRLPNLVASVVAHARRMESDMYFKANSRSEYYQYYHLQVGKIYKIQKEVEEEVEEEKRNRRRNTATVAAATPGYDWSSRRRHREFGLYLPD